MCARYIKHVKIHININKTFEKKLKFIQENLRKLS